MKSCEIKRTRAGGPGGQHRNKVESAIVILHESGISGRATERRSQHENRRVALHRLRVNLAISWRTPELSPQETKTASEISDLWATRCVNKKISVASDHEDFPCILAEAMTAIVCYEFQVSDAAKHLGCSTSQLIKLLKIEDAAFQLVNDQRQKLGLSTLK
jgi:hypothetical protein